MLLAELPQLLLRRWYAVFVGLLGCLLLAVMAARAVPPRLEMTASIVMLPPAHSLGVGGNPYLGLTGLEASADVVARRVASPDMQDDLARLGVEKFTVVRDLGTAAPMLLITVTGTDEAVVREGVRRLVAAVPVSLLSLQQSVQVPAKDLITTRLVTSSADPTVLRSPQLRAVLVAVAGGLLVTLVFVVLLDLALNRLRRWGRARKDRRRRPDTRVDAFARRTDLHAGDEEPDDGDRREATGHADRSQRVFGGRR